MDQPDPQPLGCTSRRVFAQFLSYQAARTTGHRAAAGGCAMGVPLPSCHCQSNDVSPPPTTPPTPPLKKPPPPGNWPTTVMGGQTPPLQDCAKLASAPSAADANRANRKTLPKVRFEFCRRLWSMIWKTEANPGWTPGVADCWLFTRCPNSAEGGHTLLLERFLIGKVVFMVSNTAESSPSPRRPEAVNGCGKRVVINGGELWPNGKVTVAVPYVHHFVAVCHNDWFW